MKPKDQVAVLQYKLAWHRRKLHDQREENLALREALQEVVDCPPMAHVIAQMALQQMKGTEHD